MYIFLSIFIRCVTSLSRTLACSMEIHGNVTSNQFVANLWLQQVFPSGCWSTENHLTSACLSSRWSGTKKCSCRWRKKSNGPIKQADSESVSSLYILMEDVLQDEPLKTLNPHSCHLAWSRSVTQTACEIDLTEWKHCGSLEFSEFLGTFLPSWFPCQQKKMSQCFVFSCKDITEIINIKE